LIASALKDDDRDIEINECAKDDLVSVIGEKLAQDEWGCDVDLINQVAVGDQKWVGFWKLGRGKARISRRLDASILVNSGRSLYEVQHLLGHTQSKTTERYAHLQRETLLKAANVVANMVGGAIPARAAVTLTHV
jgi:hypothetical protein